MRTEKYCVIHKKTILNRASEFSMQMNSRYSDLQSTSIYTSFVYGNKILSVPIKVNHNLDFWQKLFRHDKIE